MRTPDAVIREAILSDSAAVREMAVDAFTGAFTPDPTIMPQVIEAVRKHGWRRTGQLFGRASQLPQTDATIEWLVAEAAQPWTPDDIVADNFRFTLARTLVEAAPIAWLGRRKLSQAQWFPEELREHLEVRLRLAVCEPRRLWFELEELGYELAEARQWDDALEHRCELFVEALAGRPEFREGLLQLLSRRYRGFDKRACVALESTLVGAAGRMRLDEAVPELVERLHEDDIVVTDAADAALRRIGSEAVVDTIAAQWAEGGESFHIVAAGVLEHVPRESALRRLREWFAEEQDNPSEDSVVGQSLAHALLGHFDPDSVEPVRELVLRMEREEDFESEDLRGPLAAASAVMGVAIPEGPSWLAEADRECLELAEAPELRDRELWRASGSEDDSYDEDDEDYDDEEYSDEDEAYDEGPPSYDDDPQYEAPIVRQTPRISRNAPCPCGSGRKYKKCCLAKDEADGL